MVYFMPGNNNWEGESVEVAEQANEALRQAMHEGQFNIDQLTKENYLAIKKAVEGMRNGTTILNIEEIKTNVSDPEITPSQKEDYRRQVIFQAFTVLSSLFHFSPDDYSFDDFASEIIKNKGLNAYLVSASCPIKPLINEADFELRGLMESLEMFEDGYSDRIGAYSSGMKKIVRDLTLAIRMAIFGVEQEHTVQADPQAEAIKESKIIAEREQVQITPLNLEEFYRFQIRQFKKIEATTLIRQLLEEALEKELNAFRAKSPQAETIPDELREQIILALELKKAELKTKTNPQLRRMFSKRPLTKVRKRQGNKGTGGLPLFEPSTATKSPADVISPYVPVDVKDLATKVQFTDPFGFQSLMINFTGRHTTGGEFRFIPAPCA